MLSVDNLPTVNEKLTALQLVDSHWTPI